MFFQGATGVELAIGVIGKPLTGAQQASIPYDLNLPPPDSTGQINGSQALRVYAQPGTLLNVDFSAVSFDPHNPPIVDVSLSGYLVSAQ